MYICWFSLAAHTTKYLSVLNSFTVKKFKENTIIYIMLLIHWLKQIYSLTNKSNTEGLLTPSIADPSVAGFPSLSMPPQIQGQLQMSLLKNPPNLSW